MNFFLRSNVLHSVRETLNAHTAAVARLYDKWSSGMFAAPWYRDEKIWKLLDSIRTFQPKAVLEIGCGDGRVLQRLALRMPDCDFWGVDISEVMLKSASERCNRLANVHLRRGDWTTPVAGQRFDIIVIKNALHLIPDLPSKLKALHRVCSDNARLIVVETVSPSPNSRDFVKGLFRVVDKGNIKINYFTRKNLLSMLSKSGWRRSYLSVVDQSMSVDDWLKFKVDDETDRTDVRALVAHAPIKTAKEMNIVSSAGRFSMLRRQVVVFLQPKIKVVKSEIAKPQAVKRQRDDALESV